jgi:hypothetical protein
MRTSYLYFMSRRHKTENNLERRRKYFPENPKNILEKH